MMNLSVIIVNYNVRELLRQCLQSLQSLIVNRESLIEVFVVDNASQDGSVEMVRREFPEIKLIASDKNLGFARANNLAIKKSSGRYLLFLNPDTTVPKETLPEMIKFMDANPEVGVSTCFVELAAGGMDPDCHRGFPTPWASFCFFTKLEKVFPRSKIFGAYHQIGKDLTAAHEVDSCCGAFMMVRREAMEEVGIWDEDFFFYGEDLDWCYRFKEKGWQVMFYPHAKIIHHKGASSGIKKTSKDITTATKESKRKVLKASTDAMRIFYNKHYRQKYPAPVNWLVLGGIKLMEKVRLSRVRFPKKETPCKGVSFFNRMKIGIDARMIQDFPTGIGNYLENLIKALAKLPSEHQFVLVGNSGNKMESWAEGKRHFEFRTVRSKPNSVHQHFLLPFEISKLKLDLFWTTPWGASVFLTGRYALTIYDLLYRRYPEIASLKARLYERFFSKWVARRAVVIFTISEFVKNDIEGFLGVKRDKICNISGAAGEAYQPFNDRDINGLAIDKVLAKYATTKPFFVYVGNFRPHKNLAALLRAFARLKSVKGMGGIKLVLVGDVDAKGRDQDSQNLLKLLKELKLQNDVILTGRIPDDREVAAILNEAVALVHPSFHEGFGLTVLEAMSCGCPVIAANTTSIPEVAGNAAILVEPHDVDKFVGAMKGVLAGERSDLRQKGLEQARRFSWEKTAKTVLETFNHVCCWN